MAQVQLINRVDSALLLKLFDESYLTVLEAIDDSWKAGREFEIRYQHYEQIQEQNKTRVIKTVLSHIEIKDIENCANIFYHHYSEVLERLRITKRYWDRYLQTAVDEIVRELF